MSERRMASEKPGPPKGEAYGIAAVTQALEGVEFPATKQDLLDRAGDSTIEWEKGQEMRLSDALDQLPDAEYPSMADVVSSVSDVMES